MSVKEDLLKKSLEQMNKSLKNLKDTEDYINEELKRIEKALKNGEFNEDQASIARKALDSSVKSYGRTLLSLQEELVNQFSLIESLKNEEVSIEGDLRTLDDLRKMRIEALTINQLSNLKQFTKSAEKIIELFKKEI